MILRYNSNIALCLRPIKKQPSASADDHHGKTGSHNRDELPFSGSPLKPRRRRRPHMDGQRVDHTVAVYLGQIRCLDRPRRVP
jgi:hypothetical protein